MGEVTAEQSTSAEASKYRMIYAITVSEDSLGDVTDCLDEHAEDDYELVAWINKGIARAVIWAPLVTRSFIIEEIEGAKIRPLGQVMDRIKDNSNTWVVPSRGEQHKVASRRIEDWHDNFFLQFSVESDNKASEALEHQGSDSDTTPRRTTAREAARRRQAVKKEQSSKKVVNDVLSMFGITSDLKDIEGNPLNLSSLRTLTSSEDD